MPSVWQVPGDTRVLRPSALGLVVDFCNDFKCKCPCHFLLSPSLLIEGCMAYLTLAPHFLSPSLLIEECVACLTWDPQFLSVLYPEAWFLRSDFPRFTCEVRLTTVDISHEYSSLISFFVWGGYWGLNLGSYTCQTSAVLLSCGPSSTYYSD